MSTRYFEKSINRRTYYFLITYHKFKLIQESGIYGTQKPIKLIKTFKNVSERYRYIVSLVNKKTKQHYKEIKGAEKLQQLKHRNIRIKSKIKSKTTTILKKKSKHTQISDKKKISKKKTDINKPKISDKKKISKKKTDINKPKITDKKKISKKRKDEITLTFFPEISITIPKYNTPISKQGILFKKDMKYTEWEGNFNDILFGIFYLLKRHRNNCVPFTQFINNEEPYLDLSLFYECNLNRKQIPIYKIIYPGNLKEESFFNNIQECINMKKRFIILPLTIVPPSCDVGNSHSNIILFDTNKKTVERFETYGGKILFGDKYFNNFDNLFEKKIIKHIKYKYLRPKDICPLKGFQLLEEDNISLGLASKRKGDPFGFCAAWSFWYADLRMTYPDIEQKKLQQKAISIIQKNPTTFRKFIRNYAQFILNKKDKFYIKLKKKHNIPDTIINKKGKILPQDNTSEKFNVKLNLYNMAIKKYLVKLIKKYTN